MFVKKFFIATIVTALFAITFSSCTHDDAVNVNDYETTYNGKFNSLSQNTSVEFRELVHYAFFGGIEKAYDPQLDFFDLDVYENYLFAYPKLIATRGSVDLDIPLRADLLDEAKNCLSPEAYLLYEELVNSDKVSAEALQSIKEKVLCLDEDGRYFMTYIINNVYNLADEYNSYITSLAATRSFGCGFAAGCCGEALGYVAACVIGGPWGVIAHCAIGIVASAFISEERC